MVTSLPEQLVAWGHLAPRHCQQMESGTEGCFCCLGLLLLQQKAFLAWGAVCFPPLRVIPSLWRTQVHPGEAQGHILWREQSLGCPTPQSKQECSHVVTENTSLNLSELHVNHFGDVLVF